MFLFPRDKLSRLWFFNLTPQNLPVSSLLKTQLVLQKQNSGECLPILLECPLVFCTRRIEVINHLRQLLLCELLVVRDIRDQRHLQYSTLAGWIDKRTD
jgi:hypothetical protein